MFTKLLEKLDDELNPDMPLKHRVAAGVIRLVVGSLAGAGAVWLYKERYINEEATESEDSATE